MRERIPRYNKTAHNLHKQDKQHSHKHDDLSSGRQARQANDKPIEFYDSPALF